MIVLREATFTDRDEILAVGKSSIQGLCGDCYSKQEISAWIEHTTREKLDKGLKDTQCLWVVAVDSDRVIGYGLLNTGKKEIQSLYIMPAYSQQGLGMKILHYLEAKAIEHQLDNLCLNSTLNAVDFYKRAGYTIIKKAKHRLTAEIELDCVAMEKQFR